MDKSLIKHIVAGNEGGDNVTIYGLGMDDCVYYWKPSARPACWVLFGNKD